MSLPFLTCPALGGCGDPGDLIRHGCTFDGSTQRISWIPAVEGDRVVFTISAWVRRGRLGTSVGQTFIGGPGVPGYRGLKLRFTGSSDFGGVADRLSVYIDENSYQSCFAEATGRLFRDPGAWMHVVFRMTGLGGAASMVLEVDGEEVPLTVFSGSWPAIGYVSRFGSAGEHALGAETSFYVGQQAFEGSLARVHVVHGQALPASAFGYRNTDGHWVPRRFTGAYGAIGRLFDFANPVDLGADSGPNDLASATAIGMTAANQVTDTPSTPRRTLNFLRFWGAYNGSMGLSRGGWQHSSTNSVTEKGAVSAQPHASGKWYYEVQVDGTFGGNFSGVGTIHPTNDTKPGERSDTVLWMDTGTLRQGAASTAHGTALASASDVLMIAMDADLGHIWFGRNGAWFAGGNPATGANPSATGLVRPMLLATYVYSNLVNQLWVNAGQSAYAYAPPDGFAAPYEEPWDCPDILNPDDWFTIRRRSGGASVADLPWDPTVHKTLVVSKREDASASWQMVDTVSGAGFAWESDDATAGMAADPNGLTAFTTNGYTVGTSTPWQGNRTDEIYRAGRRAGFDILTVNHVNGVASTVPHAAGGPIDYAWVVRVDAGADRRVHHRGMSAGQYLRLNSVSGPGTDAGWFTSTANDLTLGAGMPTGIYRLYVWRAVPQFSAFPTYSGNGSADGPMLLADFAPRKLDTHRLDGSGNWYCLLPPVAGGNPAGVLRYYEVPAVPAVGAYADLNSNGAKVRNTDGSQNGSGTNNIAAMWAAAPAKFARAR